MARSRSPVLSFDNVGHCRVKALRVVDPTCASVPRPRSPMGRNQTRAPKPPGCPQLELGHHPFRRHIGRTRDDDVHVVRADVDGSKLPTAQVTMIGNGLLNSSSRFVVQNIRNRQQGPFPPIMAYGIRWNQRRSGRVVRPVYGTTIISV